MLTFHELYEAYAPDVYRFAYWLAGDSAEAEDITSETFIRAWVNVGAIRTETLKAYLLTIARNIFLGQIRKRKFQAELGDTYPDPHLGPGQLAEVQADLDLARKILKTLPEIDRTAFILRVQQELPYAEIARILQLSVAAAKVKIHRIRLKMLAAQLRQEVI